MDLHTSAHWSSLTWTWTESDSSDSTSGFWIFFSMEILNDVFVIEIAFFFLETLTLSSSLWSEIEIECFVLVTCSFFFS